MDITEAAHRIGALAWTEQRLFEVVGGWVPSTAEPDAKLLFARLSRHHGDHVVALTAVLPDTRDHDAAALVAPGADDPSTALDGATTDARLEALLLVLARQVDAIAAFLADGAPIRDGPALRVTSLVLAEDSAAVEAATEFRDGNR
jgi:hypothetical protein